MTREPLSALLLSVLLFNLHPSGNHVAIGLAKGRFLLLQYFLGVTSPDGFQVSLAGHGSLICIARRARLDSEDDAGPHDWIWKTAKKMIRGLVLSVVCLLAVGGGLNDLPELSGSDLKSLEDIREGYVDEVGGFEAGKGQPSSILLTLINDRRVICKNGRLAYHKMDQLVNEVYAFYLDRLLGFRRVPPATISEYSGRRFKTVRDRDILQQYWKRGDPMVCSEFVDNLIPASLPKVFTKWQSASQLNVIEAENLGWSESEKREAEVWGSVIMFDFLIGNSERLSASLDGNGEGFLPRAKRKSDRISLSKCRTFDCTVEHAYLDENGRLVLVDNNSGFFYDKTHFQPMDIVLSDMCIFPRRLVDRFEAQDGHALRKLLTAFVVRNEPEGPMQTNLRVRIFGNRYETMMKHIAACRLKHNGRVSFF